MAADSRKRTLEALERRIAVAQNGLLLKEKKSKKAINEDGKSPIPAEPKNTEKRRNEEVENEEDVHIMAGGSMYSSGSSVTDASVRRKGLLCDCGVQAPVVTTWTNENGNFGRRFYGCGLFKEQNKRVCDFFVWYDQAEGCPRDKKVIAGLVRRLERMKKKEKMLELCCGVGWAFVLLLLVIVIVKMMK